MPYKEGAPRWPLKPRPTSHSSAAAINNTNDDELGMTPELKLWNLYLHTAADRRVDIVRVNPALRVFGPNWTQCQIDQICFWRENGLTN